MLQKDFKSLRNTRIANEKLVFISGIPKEMATEKILKSE